MEKLQMKPSGFSNNCKVIALCLVLACFAFSACQNEVADQVPLLGTIQAVDADFTSTTANLKGEIMIVGNQDIVEYGIQISASMTFTTYTDKKIVGTPAVGPYTVSFTGLNPNTIYYYRAYAIVNTAHVYAPNPLHFTTKAK